MHVLSAHLVELDVAFPSPVPIEEAVGKNSKMLVCGQCTDIRSAPECKTLAISLILLFLCILLIIIELHRYSSN